MNVKWEKRSSVVVLLVLSVLAFSTRALPLSISLLPYNNDGVVEARLASDILLSGTLSYPEEGFYIETHSVITPAYDIFLAFCSSCLGLTPFELSQYVVAAISILTITGIYAISMQIVRNMKAALMGAMVLSLSGTFVFLTASTWKASLGVALLVLLAYAHMNRSRTRLLALEILLLFVLILVHHLVAAVAYLAIAYASGTSIATSVLAKRFRVANAVDLAVISIVAVCALLYYSYTNLDRLTGIISEGGLLITLGVFLVLLFVTILIARQKLHSRFSYAPIPSVVIGFLVVWEYHNPLFPYVPGYPMYVLALGLITAVLVGFAWYGIESLIMTRSRYRLIPLVWLLPVMTILLYAVVNGFNLSSFQIVYRSFDLGYVSIALGVACAVAATSRRPGRERMVVAVVSVLILMTFPFGYMTNELEGIRHDSQQYEVDALTWVDAHEGDDAVIQSDERISHIGLALFDFVKRPHIVYYLGDVSYYDNFTLYVYLDEWAVVGVNDYPYGHVTLDETLVCSIIEVSDSLYVGGPEGNSVSVFRRSEIGYAALQT